MGAMRSSDSRSETKPPERPKSDLARMRAYLAAEMAFEDIADATGWDYDKIRGLQATIFAEEERSVVGRRREETFVDYVIRSRAHIAQLDVLAADCKSTNQASAAVGAILGKQKILDSIIARGQELGFIDKKPERRETAIGLARLDDRALAERIAAESAAIRGLMASYGNGVPFIEVEGVPALQAPPPDAAARAPAPARETAPRTEPPPTRAPAAAPPPAPGLEGGRAPGGAAGLIRRKAIPTGVLSRPVAAPGR